MNIIETIIKQQGEDSTTVQALRQFFPIIEQAASELRAERDGLREALQLMLDRSHPAYVEDVFLRDRLIDARETARTALDQQEAEK